MPKNIVICCDGTGNEYGDRNSNVVQLYQALIVDGKRQVGYYHPGVGTEGSPTSTNKIRAAISVIAGLAIGAGILDNISDAYRYLMENYNDNGGKCQEDEVYILGFSRGAYTARALAGLLHGYGLLCRGNEGHLPYAWRMYVDQHNERGQREIIPDDVFRLTFSHQNLKIRFLGITETSPKVDRSSRQRVSSARPTPSASVSCMSF